MRFYFTSQFGRTPQFAKLLALAFTATLAIPSWAASDEYEDWTTRFQGTYAWQNKPSMQAGYSGQNSLQAEKEKSYNADRGPANFFGMRFHAEF